MVRWCAVTGCNNRNKSTKGESLFKLPAVIRHSDEMARKMSERRRIRWLARLNRRDLTPSQLCESRSSLLVCSRHFVSGKPSGLFDDKNPDWAPSLHLGHGQDRNYRKKKVDKPSSRSGNDDVDCDSGDGGVNDSGSNVKAEVDPQPARLELDFVRIPKKRKMYEDDMDWVAVRVELSKQKIKLHRCAQKLKKLKSQREMLLGKFECLQILANIDIDLLRRTVNFRKHKTVKEDWDKLYCLVMTIKSEEDLRKICTDDGETISDVEEDDDNGKKTGKLRKKALEAPKKYAELTERHDVACQCREKRKNTVQDMQVQTDINIITQLPDLPPKNKEQVYLVLEYGKDGQKVNVTTSDNSPGQESQDNGPTSLSTTEALPFHSAGREVIKVPGISSEPVNVIPVACEEEQQKDIQDSRTSDTETQDISIPDFSTEPLDLLPAINEEESQHSMTTTKRNLMQNDFKSEPTSAAKPSQIKRIGRRPTRSVVERKVVIKKLQHPFLVQSPSNSTALVMSNSNRGGQYKVFRRETICKICGKVFPSMMDQQIHARLDHLGKKVYECEICGKKFSYENDLRRHTIYHTKQKNYQCSECGKTFVSNPGLVSHVESVHKGIKHRCNICGQEYIRKNSLRIHMAGKHNPKKQVKFPSVPAAAVEPKPGHFSDPGHDVPIIPTQDIPMQGMLTHVLSTHGMDTQAVATHRMPTSSIQTHEMPTSTVLTHGMPTSTVQTHDMPTSTVLTHIMPASTVQTHIMPTSTIQTHEMPTSTIQTHGMPTLTVQTHGIPTQSIQTHRIPTQMQPEGMPTHAMPMQGMQGQVMSTQAIPTQGMATQGLVVMHGLAAPHPLSTPGMVTYSGNMLPHGL